KQTAEIQRYAREESGRELERKFTIPEAPARDAHPSLALRVSVLTNFRNAALCDLLPLFSQAPADTGDALRSLVDLRVAQERTEREAHRREEVLRGSAHRLEHRRRQQRTTGTGRAGRAGHPEQVEVHQERVGLATGERQVQRVWQTALIGSVENH